MQDAVTRVVDDNTFVFEMYASGKKGKREKMMEMTYTHLVPPWTLFLLENAGFFGLW